MPLPRLRAVRDQLDLVLRAAEALQPKSFLPIEDAPLDLTGSAPLVPFRGFDLLADSRGVERYAGKLTEARSMLSALCMTGVGL